MTITAFQYNIDLKLRADAAPHTVEFINMTIEVVPPGAQQLRGTWRGPGNLVPSTGGEFDWDGRVGHQVAFVFDGPSAGARLVVGLLHFIGPGGLPTAGISGGGSITDPNNPQFLADITWTVT